MGQAKGTVMALISPTVVEQKYGIPVAQLRRWRAAGTGPEYFRLRLRSIAYYTPDLHARPGRLAERPGQRAPARFP